MIMMTTAPMITKVPVVVTTITLIAMFDSSNDNDEISACDSKYY